MANFTQRPKSRRSAEYKAKKTVPEESKREESEKDEEEDEEESPHAGKYAKKQEITGGYAKKKKEPLFTRIMHSLFPCKGDSAAEAVRKIVFDVAVVALVITGGSVLYDVLDEARQISIVEKEVADIYINGSVNLEDSVKEEIKQEKPEIIDNFMGLYAQNPDIVGWIQLGDFINYPVVQADDNDYYLDHNFNREVTKSGAIFADYRNVFEPGKISGNTVLYGHNVWSGSMFARLSRYYDATLKGEYANRLDFYKQYPTITFNTLYEESEWKVFACVLFNTREDQGEVYPYTQVREFGSKEEFNSYILDIMDRSILWTDVDFDYGDSILTLSTCYIYGNYSQDNEVRCAVFARKVREGESSEVDVSKAVINPNPLMFTYQRRAENGAEWKGRSWDTSKLLSYGVQ